MKTKKQKTLLKETKHGLLERAGTESSPLDEPDHVRRQLNVTCVWSPTYKLQVNVGHRFHGGRLSTRLKFSRQTLAVDLAVGLTVTCTEVSSGVTLSRTELESSKNSKRVPKRPKRVPASSSRREFKARVPWTLAALKRFKLINKMIRVGTPNWLKMFSFLSTLLN